ncbi:MAG: hypothetical protein WEB52_11150 [Dehalococcoidia bacterium]
MDDGLLASRAAAGDLDSFGQLYDRYFIRVYDFAWRTLGDPAEAAAATEDAFARTVDALQHPVNAPTFRSLLFSAAHTAVVARADAPGDDRSGAAHDEAFGAFDVPDPSHIENPAAVRGDYELAALGWEAFASLTARDYALLDLHLRQGLSVHEIAHVLGTSKKEAEAIVRRMTKAASEAIDSSVIARRGTCPQLREAMSPFAMPPLNDEARAAAQQHVATCDVCQQEKLRLPNMLELLAAFSAIAAPHALKGDVWGSLAARWRIPPASMEDTLFEDEPFGDIEHSPYGARADVAGGVPPYYPRERAYGAGRGSEWTRNKVMIFAAAAIGLLVFAFAGGAVISGAFDGGDEDGGAVAADPTSDASPGISTPDAETPGGPGVVVETPTEDPNATATATEAPTETPAPQATATTPPAPPPPPPPPTAIPATPTPEPVDPNPTPTRRALIPIGTPTGQ